MANWGNIPRVDPGKVIKVINEISKIKEHFLPNLEIQVLRSLTTE